MKVKGKRIINFDGPAEFANSLRGQYIVSQALVIAIKELKKLEDREEPYPKYGTHAQPSNRADMELLLDAFPLFRIHDEEMWKIQKEEQ